MLSFCTFGSGGVGEFLGGFLGFLKAQGLSSQSSEQRRTHLQICTKTTGVHWASSATGNLGHPHTAWDLWHLRQLKGGGAKEGPRRKTGASQDTHTLPFYGHEVAELGPALGTALT